MSTLRILYHLARADFLERTRRYSFLIMLGLVLYLGYAVNIGQITLRLDAYRGVFNSAWVVSMMALVINFFLGWFGFYLIKNAITRDYETGVGQIIATTPLSRPVYALGKWLSNFAILGVMVVVLVLAAMIMQLLQREEAAFNLWALIAPFLFVALPFMALTAALAVLFESVGWLRGGFGNLVYFFFFTAFMAVFAITIGPKVAALDWLGFGLFSNSMGEAARVVFPQYHGGISLGMMPPSNLETFNWPGVTWTLPVILPRLATLALAVGVVLFGSLFFDRFDASRLPRRVVRKEPAPDISEAEPVAIARPSTTTSLTELSSSGFHFRFGTLLLAELRLMFKGLRWWWYAVALGLIAACIFSPPEVVQKGLLQAVLLWPVLLWSSLGCRAARYDTRQMMFSALHPLAGQLAAEWLAGLCVAVATSLGAIINFPLNSNSPGLIALCAGMAFIPSLAMMLGVWTGSSKAFEIIYVLLWYLGPLNRFAALDFSGVSGGRYWPVYILISAILIALAVLGRKRQLQSR